MRIFGDCAVVTSLPFRMRVCCRVLRPSGTAAKYTSCRNPLHWRTPTEMAETLMWLAKVWTTRNRFPSWEGSFLFAIASKPSPEPSQTSAVWLEFGFLTTIFKWTCYIALNGSMITNSIQRMWKDNVVTCSKVLPSILLGGLSKTANIQLGIKPLVQFSNPRLSK